MESIPKPLQIASKNKKANRHQQKNRRKIAQFAKFHQKNRRKEKKLRKKLALQLDF